MRLALVQRAADSTGASTGASAGAGGVALAAAGGAATTCRNRLTNCAKWKANGYCAATWFYNDRSVGSYWCRKTCRKCGTTTGGTTTGGTTTGGTTACPPPPPPSPRPDVGIASSEQMGVLKGRPTERRLDAAAATSTAACVLAHTSSPTHPPAPHPQSGNHRLAGVAAVAGQLGACQGRRSAAVPQRGAYKGGTGPQPGPGQAEGHEPHR